MAPPRQKSISVSRAPLQQSAQTQLPLSTNGLQWGPLLSSAKKRRLLFLPTIAEIESDNDEDCDLTTSASSSPIGQSWSSELEDPCSIASDAELAHMIMSKLQQADDMERNDLFLWLAPVLSILALSQLGSEVVQCAFEAARGAERDMLLAKLKGSVSELCLSPRGHLVLTTAIERMPVSSVGFIAKEVASHACMLARNRFGYRVLEVMIMHCSEAQISEIARELALDALLLARDCYGNFVIQHLLEYGSAECQAGVIEHLLPHIHSLAMDRTASNVLERALDLTEDDQQRLLVDALLKERKQPSLADIACSRRGSAILVQLSEIDSCNDYHAHIQKRLSATLPRLMLSKFGRRVVDSFGLLACELANSVEVCSALVHAK